MPFLNGKCYEGRLSTGVGKPAAYWKVYKNQYFRSQVCEGSRFFLGLEIEILWTSVALRALKCPWRMTVFRKCIKHWRVTVFGNCLLH